MMHSSRNSARKMSPTSLSLVCHVCVKQKALASTEFNYPLEEEAGASYKDLSRCLGMYVSVPTQTSSLYQETADLCLRAVARNPEREEEVCISPVTSFIKWHSHCVWQFTPRAKTARVNAMQHLHGKPTLSTFSCLRQDENLFSVKTNVLDSGHWDNRVLWGPWSAFHPPRSLAGCIQDRSLILISKGYVTSLWFWPGSWPTDLTFLPWPHTQLIVMDVLGNH